MPRKRESTWQGSPSGRPGRWKKIYKGRTVYCGNASAKCPGPGLVDCGIVILTA